MGVSFGADWHIMIKGSEENFEKIIQIVHDYTASQLERYSGQEKWWLDNFKEYDEIFTDYIEECLNQGDEVCHIYCDEGDDRHGIIEGYMDTIDQALPELGIAIIMDYHGDGERATTSAYSPIGKCSLNFGDTYAAIFSNEGICFPDDMDWLPYGLRHPDKFPPYGKANGTIEFLGNWSESDVSSLIDEVCTDDFQKKLTTVRPAEDNECIFEAADGKINFNMSGPYEFLEVFENIDLFLNIHDEFIDEKKYKKLCDKIYNKNLIIHMETLIYGNPNRFWDYQNCSKYHFIISSDGQKLISRFVWCGTYSCSFSGDLSPLWSKAYELITEKEYELLTSAEKLAVQCAIFDVSRVHEFDLPRNYDVDEDDEDYEDYEDYEDEDSVSGFFDFITEHRCELEEKITHNLKYIAKDKIEKFNPIAADDRLSGKKFVICGEFSNYKKEELQQLIEDFGGRVLQRVTLSADYALCGSEIGKRFTAILEKSVPIITEEYFMRMLKE